MGDSNVKADVTDNQTQINQTTDGQAVQDGASKAGFGSKEGAKHRKNMVAPCLAVAEQHAGDCAIVGEHGQIIAGKVAPGGDPTKSPKADNERHNRGANANTVWETQHTQEKEALAKSDEVYKKRQTDGSPLTDKEKAEHADAHLDYASLLEAGYKAYDAKGDGLQAKELIQKAEKERKEAYKTVDELAKGSTHPDDVSWSQNRSDYPDRDNDDIKKSAEKIIDRNESEQEQQAKEQKAVEEVYASLKNAKGAKAKLDNEGIDPNPRTAAEYFKSCLSYADAMGNNNLPGDKAANQKTAVDMRKMVLQEAPAQARKNSNWQEVYDKEVDPKKKEQMTMDWINRNSGPQNSDY